MAYVRKTRDEFQIFLNYGGGWEHEISEDNRKDMRERLKEYRENCPQYPIKWKIARVKIEASAS
jgi:hypothetical protein